MLSHIVNKRYGTWGLCNRRRESRNNLISAGVVARQTIRNTKQTNRCVVDGGNSPITRVSSASSPNQRKMIKILWFLFSECGLKLEITNSLRVYLIYINRIRSNRVASYCSDLFAL